MLLNHFIKKLDKLQHSKNTFEFHLGRQIELSDLTNTEKKLEIKIPDKIKSFYLVLNGLKTINPVFEIIDFDSWSNDKGFIHFATFDQNKKIYFDTRKLNEAEEWSILNKDNNYEITKTISSFWSNKIWKWIEYEKTIWNENWLYH